jgi:hypothetical protein
MHSPCRVQPVTLVSSDPQPRVPLVANVGLRFRAAYARLEPEIAAIAPEQLAHLCIDVHDAVTTVLGAVPKILRLRQQVSVLPFFDVSAMDRLLDCALALGHAHTLYLAESKPVARLPALKQRALVLRRDLRADMKVLIRRGLLPDDCLANLHDSNNPCELAADLLLMVEVLRRHSSAIAGKSAIRASELNSTEQFADELVQAIGEKMQKPKRRGDAALMRRKAFTLLVTTYEQVWRAVAFLRADYGDAEEIAPSLYRLRGKRAKEKRRQARAPGAGRGDTGAHE